MSGGSTVYYVHFFVNLSIGRTNGCGSGIRYWYGNGPIIIDLDCSFCPLQAFLVPSSMIFSLDSLMIGMSDSNCSSSERVRSEHF